MGSVWFTKKPIDDCVIQFGSGYRPIATTPSLNVFLDFGSY